MVAARSDARAAQAAAALATDAGAAPRVRRLVRSRRSARVADRCHASAGVRSGPSATRARRARSRSVAGGWRATCADGRQRRWQVFCAHGGAHARASAGTWYGSDHRHGPVAARRLPQFRQPRSERSAAGERSCCWHGRSQRDLRHGARHYARVRLHADRRCAGLSAASAQSPPPGSGARGNRSGLVADARDRCREHVHRVSHFHVLRRDRPRAARVLHGGFARGRWSDDAVRAAGADGAHRPRLRRFAFPRPTRGAHRYAATDALDSTRARRGSARSRDVRAASLLGKRPLATHAGAARSADDRSAVALRAGHR